MAISTIAERLTPIFLARASALRIHSSDHRTLVLSFMAAMITTDAVPQSSLYLVTGLGRRCGRKLLDVFFWHGFYFQEFLSVLLEVNVVRPDRFVLRGEMVDRKSTR